MKEGWGIDENWKTDEDWGIDENWGTGEVWGAGEGNRVVRKAVHFSSKVVAVTESPYLMLGIVVTAAPRV